ncbi:unnamed protein product [Rotaria magnacalcarata]|uniref:Uncharacterized protein n=1 Tax=Rotaria magnacalcarata TaxID=392030 RepID=A0A815MT17_9BILA|nr:unnamed protein product [Rotaria magnacalcarata]CAF5204460.1 unnamed protein product [Rotaria magnacalcarata]
MAQKLLRLNILTESEILILDGRNGEDSDEEDRFNEADDEEDDCAEDDEEEGCTESDDDEDSTEDDDEDDDRAEDADVEDCVEELNEVFHDYCLSEDDPQPTAGFENLRTTSYSGID